MKLFSPTKVIIAAIFFFSVATFAHGQCYSAPYYSAPYYSAPYYSDPYYSDPYYSDPIYASIYTAPAPCTVLVKSEYQNIHYRGTVRTKEYVVACLPDGKRTTIPIINGIAPLIDQSYSGGFVTYGLDYDFGERWNGKNPISYTSEKKQPPRVTGTKEMIQKMEKTPPAVAPPKLEEAPMRTSPGMKKPSEITPKGS